MICHELLAGRGTTSSRSVAVFAFCRWGRILLITTPQLSMLMPLPAESARWRAGFARCPPEKVGKALRPKGCAAHRPAHRWASLRNGGQSIRMIVGIRSLHHALEAADERKWLRRSTRVERAEPRATFTTGGHGGAAGRVRRACRRARSRRSYRLPPRRRSLNCAIREAASGMVSSTARPVLASPWGRGQ